jgi:murein DD-endopeptidase MepM/ murein hydrolase activator NlpD
VARAQIVGRPAITAGRERPSGGPEKGLARRRRDGVRSSAHIVSCVGPDALVHASSSCVGGISNKEEIMPFPLPFIPNASYKSGGRRFGADRDHGKRKHAACDLIAPLGTPIFAVDDGVVVLEADHKFYRGTFSLAIRHQAGYIVRYCEIKGVADGLRMGSPVRAGQLIAHVGKMFVDSMLHFELYAGNQRGPLTDRSNPPFQRRADLVDPTSLLDRLAHDVLRSPTSAATGAGGGLGVGSSLEGGILV